MAACGQATPKNFYSCVSPSAITGNLMDKLVLQALPRVSPDHHCGPNTKKGGAGLMSVYHIYIAWYDSDRTQATLLGPLPLEKITRARIGMI